MAVANFYVSNIGSGAWTNVSNAYGQPNGTVATRAAARRTNEVSYWRGLNIAGTIPDDATINSVTVSIHDSQASTSTKETLTFRPAVSTTLIGTVTTSDRTTELQTTTSANQSVSLSELRNASFGVWVNIYSDSSGSVTHSIDAIWVTVDYTLSSTAYTGSATLGGSGSLSAAGTAPGQPVIPTSPFTWSGREWNIKDSGNTAVGPGPNVFNGSQLALTNTDLTLNVKNVNGTWQSSEIVSTDSLGYGKYEWVWDTPKHPSTWDRNPVSGMFIYSFTQQNGTEPEIDWELAQFGDTGSARLWASNHPAVIPSSTEGMGFYPDAVGPYTSTFWWQVGKVYYRTTDANGKILGENQTTRFVPIPSDEKVRMNLWLINGLAPTDSLNYSIVYKSFTFTANSTATNQSASSKTNTLDQPHGWMLYGPTTVSGGSLNLPTTTGYTSSARTGMVYDLNNSSITVETLNVPTGTSHESEVQVRYDVDNRFGFIQSGGSLIFVHVDAGTGTNTSVSFDAVNHKFWRINNASGNTVTYETSADGITWAVQRTVTTTLTAAQRSGVQLNIIAGQWQAETAGTFQIATINPSNNIIATGNAALSGSGSLSLSRRPLLNLSMAFSGSGTQTVAAFVIFTRSISYTGTGVLTLSTNTGFNQSLNLSGSGALNLTGKTSHTKTLNLSGSGNLTTTRIANTSTTLGLSGFGSATTTRIPNVSRELNVSGNGTLVTDIKVNVSANASLTGLGTLSYTRSINTSSELSSSGSGALTLNTKISLIGGSSLSGEGTLSTTASGLIVKNISLSGAGSLSLATNANIRSSSSLSGNGALSFNQKINLTGNSSLSGLGALTTKGILDVFGDANLGGSGYLITDGIPRHTQTTFLSGTGSLATNTKISTSSSINFAGSGALTLLSQFLAMQNTELSGTGALSTHKIAGLSEDIDLSGEGNFKTESEYNIDKILPLNGSGNLSTETSINATETGNFNGDGSLFGSAGTLFTQNLRLSGDSNLEIIASDLHTINGTLINGSGEISTTEEINILSEISLTGVGTFELLDTLISLQKFVGFNGNSELILSLDLSIKQLLPLGGSGNLTTSQSIYIIGNTTLSGDGSLVPAYGSLFAASMQLSGSGELNTDSKLTVSNGVDFESIGDLTTEDTEIYLERSTYLKSSGNLVTTSPEPSIEDTINFDGQGTLNLSTSSTAQGLLNVIGVGELSFTYISGQTEQGSFEGDGSLLPDINNISLNQSALFRSIGELSSLESARILSTLDLSGAGYLSDSLIDEYSGNVFFDGLGELLLIGNVSNTDIEVDNTELEVTILPSEYVLYLMSSPYRLKMIKTIIKPYHLRIMRSNITATLSDHGDTTFSVRIE